MSLFDAFRFDGKRVLVVGGATGMGAAAAGLAVDAGAGVIVMDYADVTLAGVAYGQTVLARAVQAAGFSWSSEDAHSALYDAEQTAKLFCTIVNAWPAPQRA